MVSLPKKQSETKKLKKLPRGQYFVKDFNPETKEAIVQNYVGEYFGQSIIETIPVRINTNIPRCCTVAGVLIASDGQGSVCDRITIPRDSYGDPVPFLHIERVVSVRFYSEVASDLQ
ncbi:hypothetical protein cce_1884 [Crocosphaera subtropica ATCC 51142]|uniref:Uncharacterized protein n=1 Tax=Crocosphaera subtropica (strain ATCC 51142 / BH68) TaxID=43989 RepID=B1X0E5_CROS5|nr:hypothetical protein [Crocosphaera subtropica]ACB51234.1 hypothetical protein cce_1884 [Crocosphaera subtropica ATCC 51142]